MFDFFTKTDKVKKVNRSAQANQKVSINFNSSSDDTLSGHAGVNIFYPKSFADIEEIIDLLTVNKQVVVNLKDVKEQTAQRVLDILSGAVYALKGAIHEIEKHIFVITPDGLTVK